MAEKKITNADGKPATERKITRADGTPVTEKPAAKKPAAEKPAEEKKVKKTDGTEVTVKPAKESSGSAVGFRIGAAVLWVAAIVFEVLAVLILFGKIAITFMPTLALVIIALVLDLICVSAGSLLWKKANRIDPASKANKVKFWLWNNMGLIVTAFAFVPFIILSLTNKNADKKTKMIATVVAVIALLIGGLVSYDWNPISAEEKDEAVEYFGDQDVYWTPYGTVYHSSLECGHLNHSDNIIKDSVEKAIEANKTRLCKDCAARDNIDLETVKSTESSDDNVIELPVTEEEPAENAPEIAEAS